MRKTILTVGKAADRKNMLIRYLNNEYKVIDAASADEAAKLRFPEALSAVLLFWDTASEDGARALRQIFSSPLLSSAPVLTITSGKATDAAAESIRLGALDCAELSEDVSVIAQRLRNIVRLKSQAAGGGLTRDKLTGMLSREAFIARASDLIAEHEPGYYILSCLDIDNFKLINDQYGTDKGDAVLKHAALCINEWVEKAGGVSARVMADRFAVLFPEQFALRPDSEEGHRKITHPPCIDGPISVRIGRCVVSDKSLSVNALYDRAALAEESVRGRYDAYIAEYDERMRARILREQSIVNAMNAALENREFEVWLQPQFNHATGALVGAEALVRWRRPDKGLISPDEFIPIFEKNGFIYELDKYIWESVCALLRRWSDEGRSPLPVSVNISRYDVLRPDFLRTVNGLVEKYALPVSLLRLEITESAFSKDAKQIIAVVKKLIDKGYTVEIDDFGSGYSSLNTLKDVPASVLKLDMKFFENSGDAQRGGNIVGSIVRMAKWLGMSVIAEGVEDKMQADYLKSIGCVYIQGFFYSKPLPVSEYEILARGVGKEEKMLALETVQNLDNNSFWDPKSMDTLIFNSYIGAACIIEAHQGKIEMLRANDKYIGIFNGKMTIETALKLNWMEYLDEKSRSVFEAAIQKSIETRDEITSELLFVNLPGCAAETYLKSALRVIASSGDHYLLYCTNENITAQRLAEQKEKLASTQLQIMLDDAGSGITATTILDGKVSFLMANDTYFDILGYTKEQYYSEVPDVFALISPDDRPWVAALAADAYKNEKPAKAEYRVMRRDGEERWVRAILSPTHFTGVEHPVQLCIFSDISPEKEAERKLARTDDQLRFLTETAHDLLAQPDSEKGLQEVLEKLLSYFDGNRAYIFELDYAKQTARNTYEVCAEGIEPEKGRLQSVPFEAAHFWLHAFDRRSYVEIADVDALDDSRAEERKTLEEQGIKSLIAVPLSRGGALLGFIGIDDPRRNNRRIDRLVALGDYLSVMLTRRDLDAKIRSGNVTLEKLMNDTPGGFVRLHVLPGGTAVPVFFNDGFCRLTGMSRDALMRSCGQDIMLCVHPDDALSARAAFDGMIENGQARSGRLRVKQSGGGYIWLMLFGSRPRDESGEVFLNLYCSDMSEQARAEQKLSELLDNLPCGAALYEVEGEKISAVHLNKRYWELVGRRPDNPGSIPVLKAIHPDDRKPLAEELRNAISGGRDVVTDIRVVHGAGGYRAFHIVGRIVPNGEGRYSAYVSYTPISDEARPVRAAIPYILSAMMEATGDLAFTKDKDLRYLSCSKSFARAVGVRDVKDIIGKTDYELMPKEIADKFRKGDLLLLSGKAESYDSRDVIPNPNGMPLYGSTSKYPLLDLDGSIVGIYGRTLDTTHAHETDSKLKLLANNIPGGLATYICNSGSAKITYFNDGFCKLFGYTREEFEQQCRCDLSPLVFKEDFPALSDQVKRMLRCGTPIDCIYRAHVKGGGFKWISLKAVVSDRRENTLLVNAVLFDVTEQQESEKRLRISEQQYRIAASIGGRMIARYGIGTSVLHCGSRLMEETGCAETINDVPRSLIEAGTVEPDSADDFSALFGDIVSGGTNVKRNVAMRVTGGAFRWFSIESTTVFDSENRPMEAVLVFTDITEQREKEAIYKKWQQSLHEKPEDSYTLLRRSLSRDDAPIAAEGRLLGDLQLSSTASFDKQASEYIASRIFGADRQSLLSLLNPDALLAGYYRGKRSGAAEYREILPKGGERWLKLTTELVQYPDSSDVEAFLLFENIDGEKRRQLLTQKRAETDPLTGILNRAAFAAKSEQLMRSHMSGQQCLLMLDVDGFKQINDRLGHGTGDEVLIELSAKLRSMLRENDLIGRLGGDEFVVFLSGISGERAISSMAGRICALLRRKLDDGITLSVSIGIAVCPKDGHDFAALYRKADLALYHAKGTGKDGFAFYSDRMEEGGSAQKAEKEE